MVSHDLKAPLRGISNLISRIEEDHGFELSGEMLLNISLIKGHATRLENMINGLLEYARIGRTQKSVEEVDIGALLLELKETLGHQKYRTATSKISNFLICLLPIVFNEA